MKGFLRSDYAKLRAGESLRTLLLEDGELRYILRRSSRRSLALQVGPDGARVAAPWHAPLAQIEAFVRGHREWLLKRLAAQASARDAAELVIADGLSLTVLGERVSLRLAAQGRSARWLAVPEGGEILSLPRQGAARALERALRARALDWFAERVAVYCGQLGVAVPAVALGSARTRWGSCSARSGIRLHWRLVLAPPELAEYVIAHEVAHLREMNHSPRFWALLAQLCPQWQQMRARLRVEGATLPVFVDSASNPMPQEN